MSLEQSFGFYTRAAEDLAARVFLSVSGDVAAERVSRRVALDRVSEGLERLSDMDSSALDANMLSSWATRLSPVFIGSGMLPVTGEALRQHFDKWTRAGTAFSPVESCPASVRRVAAEALRLGDALRAVANEGSLSVAVAARDPVVAPEECPDSDLVVFAWTGDRTRTPMVDVAVIGDGELASLSAVMLSGDPESEMDAMLAGTPGVSGVLPLLSRLSSCVDAFNQFSARARQGERMEVRLRDDGQGLSVDVCWDGQSVVRRPVAAAPQPAAIEFCPEPAISPKM